MFNFLNKIIQKKNTKSNQKEALKIPAIVLTIEDQKRISTILSSRITDNELKSKLITNHKSGKQILFNSYKQSYFEFGRPDLFDYIDKTGIFK